MSTALRFTTDEYDRMISQGVFDGRDRRIELIFGELREMTPPGPAHEDIVDLLNRWSHQNTSPEDVRIRVQNSIGIPELDSVSLPDLAWVAERSYRSGRPQSSDVLLLIEVSDSTLRYDRGKKSRLYAEAGIREYWIVNVRQHCVEVHRRPSGGAFREKQTFDRDGSLAPEAVPAARLDVRRLFGDEHPADATPND